MLDDMIEALNEATNMGFTRIGDNAEDGWRFCDIRFPGVFSNLQVLPKNMGRSGSDTCDTLGYESPKSIYDRVSILAKK